jgi:hypothetical protein
MKTNKPQFNHLLTPEFFEEFYNKKKMNYREIARMLNGKGIRIAMPTVKKYGRNLGFGRTLAESKAHLDWRISHIDEQLVEKLDGLLLSDGHISPNGALSASLKYPEFARYLGAMFGCYATTYTSITQGTLSYLQFRTKVHPDIKAQRARWYSESRKQIPADVRITPTSVLLWYLGDGGLCVKDGRMVVTLYTNSFTKSEVRRLSNEMASKGIPCSCKKLDNQGTYKRSYWIIQINSRDCPQFFKFIGECPVACYMNKFAYPDWLPGSLRIRTIAKKYKLNEFTIRHVLKRYGAIREHRIREGGRIWVTASDLPSVIAECNLITGEG